MCGTERLYGEAQAASLVHSQRDRRVSLWRAATGAACMLDAHDCDLRLHTCRTFVLFVRVDEAGEWMAHPQPRVGMFSVCTHRSSVTRTSGYEEHKGLTGSRHVRRCGSQIGRCCIGRCALRPDFAVECRVPCALVPGRACLRAVTHTRGLRQCAASVYRYLRSASSAPIWFKRSLSWPTSRGPCPGPGSGAPASTA